MLILFAFLCRCQCIANADSRIRIIGLIPENSRFSSLTFDKALASQTGDGLTGFTASQHTTMAYVILSATDRELTRLELTGAPVVIGRSSDCDLSVHDILLSRRHCRLTPTTDGWLVIDLGSKNGVTVAGRKIEQRRLKDGDVVLIGKTTLTFRASVFIAAPKSTHRPTVPTPLDPSETLSGTMFAMEYVEERLGVASHRRITRMPTPKPRPRDPESFESDDVYSMLVQIASSSWDSIYAVNAQPLRRDRPLPRPRLAAKAGDRLPRASHAGPRVSLALQATAPKRSIVIAPPPPRARQTFNAAALIRKRVSNLTRWVSRVGQLRMF